MTNEYRVKLEFLQESGAVFQRHMKTPFSACAKQKTHTHKKTWMNPFFSCLYICQVILVVLQKDSYLYLYFPFPFYFCLILSSSSCLHYLNNFFVSTNLGVCLMPILCFSSVDPPKAFQQVAHLYLKLGGPLLLWHLV